MVQHDGARGATRAGGVRVEFKKPLTGRAKCVMRPGQGQESRNARTHSPEQVDQISASIREWGWTIPVLVDDEGGIIAGHGRVLAAHKLAIAEVPVMVAAGWSEAQKRAYVLADNKLALNAGWDNDLLRIVPVSGREACRE
jgi:ParB-like chromosome segregation protein Spo0J